MSFQAAGEEFRAIFENSIDAIAVFRGPLHMLVNRAYLVMFGYDAPDELIGTPIKDRIAPSELERVQGYALRRIAGEPAPNRYETRGLKRNGDEFDMSLHVSTYELNGEIFTIIILRDITEQKRLQDEARKAEILRVELEKEKEIITLKDRILTTVSHEFRTPLTVIQTSNYLLSRHSDRLPKERVEQLHRQIDEQITHLNDLIRDTLSISQSHIGRMAFSPMQLHLEPFCRNVFERIKANDVHEHHFKFICNAPDVSIMADHDLLNYALTNLLTNAVQYSPAGSEIELTLGQDADYVIIRVRDTGIGIPEKDLARLFEPFHRATNIDNAPGTGLGLAVAQQYVQLHGGRIEVESHVGRGSIFKILLPMSLTY